MGGRKIRWTCCCAGAPIDASSADGRTRVVRRCGLPHRDGDAGEDEPATLLEALVDQRSVPSPRGSRSPCASSRKRKSRGRTATPWPRSTSTRKRRSDNSRTPSAR